MNGVAAEATSAGVGYGLLDGVVVVEVANELTEYAGTMLAGLGAEVWLGGGPGGPPPRRRHPFAPGVDGSRRSIPFVARNPGKKSVVIDPDDAGDRRTIEGLFRTADVI